MFRRSHLFVTLLSVLAIGAVSAGCKDDEKATSRVVFDSSLFGSPQDCKESGTWFKIGEFGNPALGRVDPTNPASDLKDPPKPVDNGSTDPDTGGGVGITCNVLPAGDAFDVSATIELSGSKGGFFKVIGRFKPDGIQQNINISMSKEGRSYTQANCTAKYETPSQTVAAGRVWAVIDCDAIESPGLQRKCKGTAQFRLENCGQ